MTKPWNWRKAYARLGGNFLISFGTPILTSFALTQEFLLSLYIALGTATIITVVATGRMLDEWSRQNGQSQNP